MRFQFLSLAVVLTFCTGCSQLWFFPTPRKPEAPKVSPPPPATVTTNTHKPAPIKLSKPVCVTKDDQSLAPERVVQRKTVELRREKQRVIRKDCSGNVISDKMETVVEPRADVVIKPTQWWSGFNAFPSSVYNRTTCSSTAGVLDLERMLLLSMGIGVLEEMGRNAKSKLGFPSVEFTVHTSPTVSHMHVRRDQENFIDYEFSTCAEKNGETCLKATPVERGTLVLTVKYSENPDIGGVKEIREEKCLEKTETRQNN